MKCLMQQTAGETRKIDFGMMDEKGRRLGCEIFLSVETFTPAPDGAVCYYCDIRPDTYFAFKPQATRNGKPFGATQSTRRCMTEAEREAAIATYINGARNRASENAVRECLIQR